MKKLNTLIIILIVVFVITAGTISFLLFKEKSAVQTSTTTSEIIENKGAIEVADPQPKQDKEITLEFVSNLYPAYPIGYELDILVNNDTDISMSSSNENIASIINNKVITKAPGMVNITASYKDQKISQEIIVTDLYTIEDTNQRNQIHRNKKMPNDFMNRYNDLFDSLEKQLNELEQIKKNQTEQIELLRTQIDVLAKQNQELSEQNQRLNDLNSKLSEQIKSN